MSKTTCVHGRPVNEECAECASEWAFIQRLPIEELRERRDREHLDAEIQARYGDDLGRGPIVFYE